VHVYKQTVIYVNHLGIRRDLPGDFVHVACRGDAGPDVEELPYARLLGEEPHCPLQECPIGKRDGTHLREGAKDLPDGFPVDRLPPR
jgi:hypothetical protein